MSYYSLTSAWKRGAGAREMNGGEVGTVGRDGGGLFGRRTRAKGKQSPDRCISRSMYKTVKQEGCGMAMEVLVERCG